MFYDNVMTEMINFQQACERIGILMLMYWRPNKQYTYMEFHISTFSNKLLDQ